MIKIAKYDYDKVKQSVRLFLEGIGDDPDRDGLKETPDRVARMYKDILSGYDIDVKQYLKLFDYDSKDMVIVKDIPFYSYCEHHLQLFVGNLSMAYIPDGKVIGLSKLVRIARVFAKRPQIQERLTKQIHDAIALNVPNKGVAVSITAEHFCMSIRGTRVPGSKTTTNKLSGLFFEDEKTRSEFLHNIK